MLTLENYAERYIPMVMLDILNEVFNPVLNDIQHKRFSKMIDILHEKMFIEITGNNGDGSIF